MGKDNYYKSFYIESYVVVAVFLISSIFVSYITVWWFCYYKYSEIINVSSYSLGAKMKDYLSKSTIYGINSKKGKKSVTLLNVYIESEQMCRKFSFYDAGKDEK